MGRSIHHPNPGTTHNLNKHELNSAEAFPAIRYSGTSSHTVAVSCVFCPYNLPTG